MGILVPLAIILFSFASVFFARLFQKPIIGVYATLIFCFVMPAFTLELTGVPLGLGLEALLLCTWVAVFFNNRKYQWTTLNNDLVVLTVLWFLISVLEVFNPADASIIGWAQELRSAALHPLLIIPLTLLLCNSKKSLNVFLILTIAVSVLGAINGLRQLKLGLTPGERLFVEEMASTHLIWGKLRVFSFFTDAGQYGASQAHIALVAGLLVFGPYKWWVRATLAVCCILLCIGMLISGTRGALFVLIAGAAVAVFLFKNFKILILGGFLLVAAIGFLKFTNIGSGNYQIYRLRTALDPKDASLNVRFYNQRILADYLKDKPFGGGLGVIGAWGHEYNSDKFLSTIEPDSYWVKVWAMYGIVGFVLWFCMMMYLLGKCGGIAWQIRDPMLRIKVIALVAGAFGVFVASYGNEVINRIPSSILVYMSMAFVYLSPHFDRQSRQQDEVDQQKETAYAI